MTPGRRRWKTVGFWIVAAVVLGLAIATPSGLLSFPPGTASAAQNSEPSEAVSDHTGYAGATARRTEGTAFKPAPDSEEEAVELALLTAKRFNGPPSDEIEAEVRTTTVGVLARTFPGWFSELWQRFPTERQAYITYLHADDRVFAPDRGPPREVSVQKGDTLIVVRGEAGEFGVRLVRNGVTADMPLDSFYNQGESP